ncbi:MAG TPA: dihydrofolate reductase family protein [Thermoanaerobaculia bacterium]|nr:dihydrofolate reductase family protein [Thermoanaerobaculia bacterium]
MKPARRARRPQRRRKIIVWIATSADGYIARPDGGVEWLDRPRPRGNYGMRAFVKSIDTILWGRKTYEVALGFTDGRGVGYGSRVKNYVFSRRPPEKHTPDVEFVRERLRSFLKRLRATPGKNVWVMGGAGLTGSLLDAGEIDELVVHVVPTLIGEGIPLAAPRRRLIALRLLSVRRFSDGVARLRYAVAPKAGRPRS